jgi:hypothetical protein
MKFEDNLNKHDELITKKEGYAAMLKFLTMYYEKSGSTDLTDILSGGGLMEDGFPLDKSFWYYWLEATNR